MAKVKEPKEKIHPDQQFIPGAEPERNEKIHKAAYAYRKARDARMGLTEDEVEAKNKLLEVMKGEKVEVYNDPSGYSVILNHNDNVKLQDGKRGGGKKDE